jgi:thioredoxin reductase
MIVKVGNAPNTELFREQLNMDASGHIAINEFCETSARKVFAVGDITRPGYPRIATAMGHGMIAAARIRSIIEQR